jgi:hypothetical protein
MSMADLSLGRAGAPSRTLRFATPTRAPALLGVLRWHITVLAVACLTFIPLAVQGMAVPIGPALLAGGFLSGGGARLALGVRRPAAPARPRRGAVLAAGLGSVMIGAALGNALAGWWLSLPALAPVFLPDIAGPVPTLVLSIAVLASAAGFTIVLEKAGRGPLARPSLTGPATAVLAGLVLPAIGLRAGTVPAAGVLEAGAVAAGLILLGRASAAGAALGGLLLGCGALVVQGGPLAVHVAGVAQGSLHGWIWLAAALAGAWTAGLLARPGTGPADGADGGT